MEYGESNSTKGKEIGIKLVDKNQTINILSLIGSPFCKTNPASFGNCTSQDFFQCAKNNKISLLFLDKLKDNQCLNGFEIDYEILCKKKLEHLITIKKIAHFLNKKGCKYIIVKSIMPFPYIPNDVDIIVMESSDRFNEIIECAKSNSYNIIGVAPLETMIHDNRNEQHKDPREKDIYDIDLYREFGAINIIYLDKHKIGKYLTEIELMGQTISILKPEAELAVVIVHSIFPEQIFTLHLYYTILFYLAEMNKAEIEKFIKIAEENSITYAVKTVISLIAVLHEEAHGFIPDKVEFLISELGKNIHEISGLQKNRLDTPYIYKFSTVMLTLIEKFKEKKSAKSIILQSIRMANPKTMSYVSKVVLERRSRETY